MRPEQDLSYHFLFLDIQKISENVALNIRAEIGQNVQLVFGAKLVTYRIVRVQVIKFGSGLGSVQV